MSKRSHRRARQSKRPTDTQVSIGYSVASYQQQVLTRQGPLTLGPHPQQIASLFRTLAHQMQALAWDFKRLFGTYHTLDPRTQRRVHNFRLIEPILRKKYARPK